MNCAAIVTSFGKWDHHFHETNRGLIGEQGAKVHLELKSLRGRAAIVLFDQKGEAELIGACIRTKEFFNGVYEWFAGIRIPNELDQVFTDQLRREISVLASHATSIDLIGQGRGAKAIVNLLIAQRHEIHNIHKVYLGWTEEVGQLSQLRICPEIYVFGDQERLISRIQLVQIDEECTEEEMGAIVSLHKARQFAPEERRVNLRSGEVIDGPEESGMSFLVKIILFEVLILMGS